MSSNYFENISESLEKIPVPESASETQINFFELKEMEFKARALIKDRFDADQGVYSGYDSYVDLKAIHKSLDSEAHLKLAENVAKILKSEFNKSSSRAIYNRDVLKAAEEFCHSSAPNKRSQLAFSIISNISATEKRVMSAEIYQKVQAAFADAYIENAKRSIKAGVPESDPFYVRTNRLREMYRLSEEEMQVFLYLLLVLNIQQVDAFNRNDENETFDYMEDDFDFHNDDFHDDNFHETFLINRKFCPAGTQGFADLEKVAGNTGVGIDNVRKILGANGALRQFLICDGYTRVTQGICRYLYGLIDEGDLPALKYAAAPSVPFAELAQNKPSAQFILDLVKMHDYKQSLNILFYGIEGTGKTELARAIAKEADLALIDISSIPHTLFSSYTTNWDRYLIAKRIEILRQTDLQCAQRPAIILMDNADLVLNSCDKGVLNDLLESLHTPIIWIVDSLQSVKQSTRRRFGYSMEFKKPSADEMPGILNSVLKAQGAESLLTENERKRLAVECPALPGDLMHAVQRTRKLMETDASAKPYETILRLLRAHLNVRLCS